MSPTAVHDGLFHEPVVCGWCGAERTTLFVAAHTLEYTSTQPNPARPTKPTTTTKPIDCTMTVTVCPCDGITWKPAEVTSDV